MKKRLLTAYKKNKAVQKAIKVIGVVLVGIILLFLLTIPVTNRKFDIKFKNITDDMGFNALTTINAGEKDTVYIAKQSFMYNISQIEQLDAPKSVLEVVFNFNAGKKYHKQQEYIAAYKKFYNSPYWSYWQEIEKLYADIKSKEDTSEKVEKEYNTQEYVTAYSSQLFNQMSELKDKIEATNKKMDGVYKLQEREYKLFTDHLTKLNEKYY